MNYAIKGLLISGILFATSAHGQAPTWSDAQAEVWSVIERSWADEVAENEKWPGEYVHAKYVAWGDFPAPRDKETYTKWIRMNEETVDTFWYEIMPLAITVQDETAVVMYSSLSGEEDKNGERTLVPYHLVETLIRENGNWKFLSSTSVPAGNDN